MERTCNYPIEIKFKIDLNTELLLNELCDLLKKDRSKILRLIIADFFDRNLDLIDKYKETDNELDREKLVEAILKDFYGYKSFTGRIYFIRIICNLLCSFFYAPNTNL